MKLSLPRLVISAPHGRSGKTTVSVGLCAAFAGRGLAVQPFKKGPDYIDPSWLTEAAGRACRNLDPFFMPGEDDLARSFVRGADGADIGIVEGNHGLYDSMEDDGRGSTAALARALQAPIVLVLDAGRMGRSAAALVLGLQQFEPDTPVAGVVLNGVGSARHEGKLRRAIEERCGIPVLGALPREPALTIPDRHLGLVPRGEDDALAPAVAACRQAVERYLDLPGIWAVAGSAAPLTFGSQPQPQAPGANDPSVRSQGPGLRIPIAVFQDRAFTFYYPENLEALRDQGAELIFVDALHDTRLPRAAALYIGGGFPELFMEELSANVELREAVRREAEAGLPIYAECGGLMYLSRRITWGQRSAEMAGVLPCEVEVLQKAQGHGYVVAETLAENPFLPAGVMVRGHEFHNSRVTGAEGLPRAYRLARGAGLGDGTDGLVCGGVLAAYTHLHAAGCPEWAAGFVAQARIG